MGLFTPTSPALLQLTPPEEASRANAIAQTGSPSPVPFSALANRQAIYSHIGHDAQYGSGRRNGRSVRLLILHVTDGDTSLVNTMSYAARRVDTVSSNAYAGRDGELGYGVAERDRAFTTGRWNDESLSLEIVGRAAFTDAQWRARPLQLEAVVRLLVDWCNRHHVPAIWLSKEEVALGASREGQSPKQGTNYGICDHYTANQAAIDLGGSRAKYSHTCVGPALRAIVINELIPEVARRLTSEEDDMQGRLVRFKGYTNVFAVGCGGPPFAVGGAHYDSLVAGAVQKVFVDHPQEMLSIVRQAGLDINNPQEMIPGGSQTAFE